MLLEFNSQVFNFLNSFSGIPWIGILADGPIFFLPVFLFGMWMYYTFFQKNTSSFLGKIKAKIISTPSYYNQERTHLLHIFYACLLWLIFSYIIKQFVDIDRPETYLEQTSNLIMSSIPAKSFPSDHATVSFAFTVALFFAGFKKIWYIFLPCIILMNLSRIIVGVHWPIDIIAGAINGTIAAIVCFKYIIPSKLVKSADIFIIDVMKKLRLY